MRPRTLTLAVSSTTAAIGLFVSPAAAAADPARNPGTVWLADEGRGHEPHLGCEVVSLWADKLAGDAGTWAVALWPPNGDGREVAWGDWASGSPGPSAVAEVDGRQLAEAAGDLGADPSERQGYHFKLELRQGDHSKMKTFWVDCPEASEATVSPASPPAGTAPVATSPEPAAPAAAPPPGDEEVLAPAAIQDPATEEAPPGGDVVEAASLVEPTAEPLDDPAVEVLGMDLAQEDALPVTGAALAFLAGLGTVLVGLGTLLTRRRPAGSRG